VINLIKDLRIPYELTLNEKKSGIIQISKRKLIENNNQNEILNIPIV